MKNLTLCALLVMLALLLVGCSSSKMSPSCWGEKDVKWHHDAKIVQLATQSPAATPGTSLGLVKIEGTAKAPGDSVSTPAEWAVTYEYDNGTGPHRGLINYKFADGSVLVLAIRGQTTVDAGGISRINGKAKLHTGTGRYAGAHGGGTYVGLRNQAIGEGATLSIDVTLCICDAK